MNEARPRFKLHPEFGICRWNELQENYVRTGLEIADAGPLVDWLNGQEDAMASAVVGRLKRTQEGSKGTATIVARNIPGWPEETLVRWLDPDALREDSPEVDEDGCIQEDAPARGLTRITISAEGKSVTATSEQFDRAVELLEQQVIPHPVQIPGGALHAVIKEFCSPRDKKSPPLATDSIGVSDTSIAATDTRMCIILGEPEGGHRTTDYRRTMIEGDWAKRMEEAVRWEALPQMGQTTDIDHPVLPGLSLDGPGFPDVTGLLERHRVEEWHEVSNLSPHMLQAVGKVAASLGAQSVTLFHDRKGEMMGFHFMAEPAIGPEKVAAEPFPVKGLLMARKKEEEGGE